MADNRIVWSGLDELRDALRALPAQLAAEAAGIVTARAERALQDISTSYPERTGNLRKGLRISRAAAGPYGAGVILRNSAKHAWIYENGTQARHTDLGANRGSMPPGHIFIPIVVRNRRAMYGELKDLLTRHGLLVTGEPESGLGLAA